MSSNRVIDPRAAERRRSILIMIVATIVLIAVAVGVIFWATSGHKKQGDGADPLNLGNATPTVLTDGAIRFTGAPAGTTPKVVVSITEDFQCPACKAFETAFGPTLATYHDNPQVALDYTTINMLDRSSSGTRYSTRAANAALCVAETTGKDHDFSKWLEFHNLMFADQPAEGGTGLPNKQILAIAKQAGVEGIDKCVRDIDYGNWIVKNSEKVMSEPGFSGTPNVRINGKVVQLNSPEELQQQIDDAVKAGS